MRISMQMPNAKQKRTKRKQKRRKKKLNKPHGGKGAWVMDIVYVGAIHTFGTLVVTGIFTLSW